jgi:hypothetical protein
VAGIMTKSEGTCKAVETPYGVVCERRLAKHDDGEQVAMPARAPEGNRGAYRVFPNEPLLIRHVRAAYGGLDVKHIVDVPRVRCHAPIQPLDLRWPHPELPE